MYFKKFSVMLVTFLDGGKRIDVQNAMFNCQNIFRSVKFILVVFYPSLHLLKFFSHKLHHCL